MIYIQLKAKHFYFIANDLKRSAIEEYYDLISKIKMNATDLTDDDLMQVPVSVDQFVNVFGFVSNKSEGQANRINTEMMGLLTPQFQAGVGSGDAEWIEAFTKVTEIRENNWAITDQAIASGKLFIRGNI